MPFSDEFIGDGRISVSGMVFHYVVSELAMLLWIRVRVREILQSLRQYESQFGSTRDHIPAILLIVGTWIFMAALIHPQGNFPLIDDWTYGGAVKSLVETGSIDPPDWSGANFISQLFWGALFCLPKGFSFTALRVSTLVLGLIGILVAYRLSLEFGANHSVALFGALLLAVNPLYLVLSYTFMTDVPFVSVCLLSVYFFVRAMKTNSKKELALGLIFACVALLIRQLAMAVFFAAGFTHLARNRLRVRAALMAFAPLLLGLAIQFLFQEWLKLTHKTPAVYQVQSRLLFSIFSHMTLRSIVPLAGAFIVFMIYLGLFTFPFLIFLGPGKLRTLFRPRFLTFLTFLFAVLTLHFVWNKRMPLLTDVLYDFGLGPPILYDTDTLHLRHFPAAGTWFWAVTTLVGVVGGVILFQGLLVAIVETCNPRTLFPMRRGPTVLFLATGIVYILPLLLLWFKGFVFDRYLLLLVPLATILLAQLPEPPESVQTSLRFIMLGILSLVLYGALSVSATHDYLSWNRARWRALDELVLEQHISPGQIDGGFEFNGTYLYSRNSPNQLLLYAEQLIQNEKSTESRVDVQPVPKKSWWWVSDDDFVVTLGPVSGFTEFKRYQFRRWLPPGEGSVLVLRRASVE